MQIDMTTLRASITNPDPPAQKPPYASTNGSRLLGFDGATVICQPIDLAPAMENPLDPRELIDTPAAFVEILVLAFRQPFRPPKRSVLLNQGHSFPQKGVHLLGWKTIIKPRGRCPSR